MTFFNTLLMDAPMMILDLPVDITIYLLYAMSIMFDVLLSGVSVNGSLCRSFPLAHLFLPRDPVSNPAPSETSNGYQPVWPIENRQQLGGENVYQYNGPFGWLGTG